jgi:hypothetical protein
MIAIVIIIEPNKIRDNIVAIVVTVFDVFVELVFDKLG